MQSANFDRKCDLKNLITGKWYRFQYVVIHQYIFFILACIGSHGFNCTSPCPPTGYGDLCRFQCLCSADKCDPVNGCTKGPGNFIIINSLLVIFDILVVLYKSVHWINILNYSFVYRKVESSVRPNWLQYKSKSILVHVKTGWYLFSTGNNTVYEMWNYRYFTWKIYTFCMLLSVPSSHSVTFLDVLNRYAHLPVKNNSNRYTEKKSPIYPLWHEPLFLPWKVNISENIEV